MARRQPPPAARPKPKAIQPKPKPVVGRRQPAPTPKPKRKRINHKRAFLEAFKITARIGRGAKAAGIRRELHYRWLKEDPEYARAFTEAKTLAAQYLEDMAIERATEGWKKPVYFQGEVVGHVYEPSERLMERLLEAHLPEKYARRTSVEHSGPGGGPIPVSDDRLTRLTDDELGSFLAIAQKLADAGRASG